MGEGNNKGVGLLGASVNKNLYYEWQLRKAKQEYRRFEQGGVVSAMGWQQPKLSSPTPTKGE